MKQLVIDPFPDLKTGRLVLRGLTVEDAEAMHRLRSNREVMRLTDRPLTRSIDEAESLIESVLESQRQRNAIMWAMSLHGNPLMIGCICLIRMEPDHHRAEVGYLLDPKFHRLGFMSEALSEVVEFGFRELEFHKITASTHPQNQPSIGLLRKHGFVEEALFRQHYFWNGQFLDSVVLARYSPEAERKIRERQINPVEDVHA